MVSFSAIPMVLSALIGAYIKKELKKARKHSEET